MQPDARTFTAGEPLSEARGMLDVLRIDLNWVHLHRKLFWEVIHEFDRDPEPKSLTWRSHYARLYADGQAAAARRLIGGPNYQRHDACLWRLLTILHDNASAITIDRLGEISAVAAGLAMSEDFARHRQTVERHWGDGSGQISSQRIEADLAKLADDTVRVRKWASKTVAHLDIRGAEAPSFGELDGAIGHVTEVFRRYGTLLTGMDYAVDENEPDLGWREPLRSLFRNGPGE